MARPLRIEFPGAVYHVTSRGNDRKAIFKKDSDRNHFLTLLGEVVHRFGWSITAFALMTNHYHLVVQTPEANLSRGMHWLNGTYAAWFNRRHKRSGHLLQGRFKAFLIDEDAYHAQVLRYVVLNPVRAGLAGRPEQHRWSSYRATAGLAPAPEWLDTSAALARFGSDVALAQAEYRAFVLGAVGSKDRLWDNVTNGLYLGTETWTKKMRAVVESRPRSTDHPITQRAVGRPHIEAIVEAVAATAQLPLEAARTTRGSAVRRLIAWLGWHEGLVTLRSIAAALRLRSEGHVSNMIRRCEYEFGKSATLLSHLDAALVALR
ncbi:MAG TPA: transposase [Thermoanaerobaculia bacterium]|jgi:REP element-mobilizing transposase RayT